VRPVLMPILSAILMFLSMDVACAAIEYANVTGGRLQGEAQNDLAVFKGVPFAAPPVGALRWKPPQLVIAWKDTREAKTFAPACIQQLWPGAPRRAEYGSEHPFGAWHAEDFPYVFGNFDKPPSAKQQVLAAQMRRYWINFAARGEPNGPGLPPWKAFDEASQPAMVFADSTQSQPLPHLQGLRAVDLLMRCRSSPN
jgi:carboxylesterase type B